jgi:penicillin amidase
LYALYSKPYEGEVALKTFKKRNYRLFDEFGVPHIYAANSKMPWIALGYVHAGSIMAMELMRRIVPEGCQKSSDQ